jgi:endonuclease
MTRSSASSSDRWRGISQHQAEEGQSVRGMIIAQEISHDLRLACSNVPDVELFEYEFAVTIRDVPL